MTTIKICPLCGSDELTRFYSGIDEYFSKEKVVFTICEKCSLVFLNPRPSKGDYKKMYEEVFQDKRRSLENIEQAVDRLEKIGSYEKKLKELKFFQDYINRESICLEIGSGWGALAKAIEDNVGCQVEGIEPSVLAAKTAREHYHLNIFNGDFDEFYSERGWEKEYDFIFSYHVIEHLLDQNDFLQKVKKLLREDGKIFLALPDITNPDYPYEKFFHIEHCYYYSPRTINLMLEKNGFQTIKLWRCEKDMKLVARVADCPRDISYRNQEKLKFKKILKKFNRRYRLLRFFKRLFYPCLNEGRRARVSGWAAALLKKIRIIKN